MPEQIAVVGAGYVGLVAAACIADAGHHVVCVDSDASRVAMLRAGVTPIFEPGLDAIIERAQRAGRLEFSSDLARARGASLALIAVGTPPAPDGSADVRAVLDAACALGAQAERELVIVIKSTVSVGTTHRALAAARAVATVPIHACSCPEFVREGNAVDDFRSPDRVVIGAESDVARGRMAGLYVSLVPSGTPIHFMDVRSAELTKQASNAMLAARVAIMNDLASLCESVDASIEHVRLGVGSDSRIGHAFLAPGPGYGGSCLPKDVQALVRCGEHAGAPQTVIAAVDAANARQRTAAFRKLREALDRHGVALRDATIALWGLAFKGGTDDLRESAAITLLEALLEVGAKVVAHDPAAVHAATRRYAEHVAAGRLRFAATAESSLDDAHALALMTDWPDYRGVSLGTIAARLAEPIVVDMRNVWDPAGAIALGVTYHSVGRAPIHATAATPAPRVWA